MNILDLIHELQGIAESHGVESDVLVFINGQYVAGTVTSVTIDGIPGHKGGADHFIINAEAI